MTTKRAAGSDDNEAFEEDDDTHHEPDIGKGLDDSSNRGFFAARTAAKAAPEGETATKGAGTSVKDRPATETKDNPLPLAVIDFSAPGTPPTPETPIKPQQPAGKITTHSRLSKH